MTVAVILVTHVVCDKFEEENIYVNAINIFLYFSFQ